MCECCQGLQQTPSLKKHFSQGKGFSKPQASKKTSVKFLNCCILSL
jgi:hypothetical protein